MNIAVIDADLIGIGNHWFQNLRIFRSLSLKLKSILILSLRLQANK